MQRIIFLLCLGFFPGILLAQPTELGPGWYPRIPGVVGFYKTTHSSTWPTSSDSNGKLILKEFEHTSYMLLSLSELKTVGLL